MSGVEQNLEEKVIELVRKDFRASSSVQVAQALHMSDRTLRRRLAALGVSYQDILNRLRYDRAQFLLQNSQCSIHEIASRLGYSDASNFGHAFRQWSNMSPRQYRRQMSSPPVCKTYRSEAQEVALEAVSA